MGRRKTVLEKGKVEENNQPTLVQRSIDKNWNILYKADLRVLSRQESLFNPGKRIILKGDDYKFSVRELKL